MSAEPKATPAAATPRTVLDVEAPELVRNYAEALVGAAEAQGQTEAVLDELDALVADVIRPNARFAQLLAGPGITAQNKDAILAKTFEGRGSPLLVTFLRVLNRHGRFALLEAIAQRAREIWNRRQNRQPVTVRSAVPLEPAQLAALTDRLTGLTGATPILQLEIDPALIGGLVVQVGDDVYDASVRHRLQQLRRLLVEGKSYEIQSRRDHFSSPA